MRQVRVRRALVASLIAALIALASADVAQAQPEPPAAGPAEALSLAALAEARAAADGEARRQRDALSERVARFDAALESLQASGSEQAQQEALAQAFARIQDIAALQKQLHAAGDDPLLFTLASLQLGDALVALGEALASMPAPDSLGEDAREVFRDRVEAQGARIRANAHEPYHAALITAERSGWERAVEITQARAWVEAAAAETP